MAPRRTSNKKCLNKVDEDTCKKELLVKDLVKDQSVNTSVNTTLDEQQIDFEDDNQSEIDQSEILEYNLTEKLLSLDKLYINGIHSKTLVLRPDNKTLFIPSSYIISQHSHIIKCSKNLEHLKQFYIDGMQNKYNILIDSRLQTFISHLFLTVNLNNIFVYDTYIHTVKTFIDYTSTLFNIQTNELNTVRIKLLHFITLFYHYYRRSLVPINYQECFTLIRQLTAAKCLNNLSTLSNLPLEFIYQYLKTPEMLQNELQAQGTGEVEITRVNYFTTSLTNIFNTSGIWKSPFKGLSDDDDLVKLSSLEIYIGVSALKTNNCDYNILN